MGKIYVGDTGTKIRVNTSTSLTDMVTCTMNILRPDATILTKSTVTEDLLTGIISYTTVANDITVSGDYKVQCTITFTGGKRFSTETRSFPVYDLYK